MKILNLILYSENDPAYPRMREVLQDHNRRYSYVQTLFYIYDPTLKTDHDISGDLLRIRGVETYVPGILNKTLEAIRITQSWDYDILVRTNISTIVDFSGLVGYCSDPGFFAGGPMGALFQIDPAGGIFDSRFNGCNIILGWCMVLSRAAISLLLEKRQFIDTSVIDDVSISDFLLRKMKKSATNLHYKCVCVTRSYDPTKLVFRNCTYGDRMADVARMRDLSSKMHP
jgi:hypothetical protein